MFITLKLRIWDILMIQEIILMMSKVVLKLQLIIISIYENELKNRHFFKLLLICRENLELMIELQDRSAQGRTYGNLGNTHYLLGNFSQATKYHEEVFFLFSFLNFIIYSNI